MKILIDRFTNQVVGFNRLATPLEFEINVDDGFTLSKTIEEITGYTEPTEEGQEPEPIAEQKTVALETSPESFSISEVLGVKYKNVLEASQCDHIIADIFLDESDLDLASPSHSANTGVGILMLLPNGQAKTKSIALEVPAFIFTLLEFDADPDVEIYVAGKIFTNGQAILTEPVQTCTIKFVNTTDKPKQVKAYAVGY